VPALDAVEHSLLLRPENRNSVLLKAAILHDLGRTAEAKQLREQAEFMAEGNWSEQMEMD
jgi:HD superfamily phosphodiesterase